MAEIDNLYRSMRISSAGMKVQGTRLRVISENIANSDSLPQTPGAEPYRRKTITFRNQLDRALGVDTVRVHRIDSDRGQLEKRYDPAHPAADADGYVLVPNVNRLVEMMDMREAERSYEANITSIRAAKNMIKGTIDILR